MMKALGRNYKVITMLLSFMLAFSLVPVMGNTAQAATFVPPVSYSFSEVGFDPETDMVNNLHEATTSTAQEYQMYGDHLRVRFGLTGDYAQFHFNVEQSGEYLLKYRYKTTTRSQEQDVYIDDQFAVSMNHNSSPSTEVELGKFELSAGDHTIKFVSKSDTMYNYLQFVGLDLLPGGESPYGIHYGADFAEFITGNPLGGGAGYNDIVSMTEATYVVSDLAGLEEALIAAAVTEDVYGPTANANFTIYVEDDATIDLSPRGADPLLVPANVTIASGRGRDLGDGTISQGGLLKHAEEPTYSLMSGLLQTTGPNVRITGIRLQGNDPLRRDELSNTYDVPLSVGIKSEYFIEVDNSEIFAFSFAGVWANDANIHHNHFHHTWRKGLGYSISMDNLSPTVGHVLAEANLFEYFRHAIAANGFVYDRYEARYNVFKEGTLHHLDMHSKDEGKVLPDGGLYFAGDWVKIHHNTFIDTDMYYSSTSTTPHSIIHIRGIPFTGVFIDYNTFENLELTDGGFLAYAQSNSFGNFHVGRNKYGPAKDVYDGSVPQTFDNSFLLPAFTMKNTKFTKLDGTTEAADLASADGFINMSTDLTNGSRRPQEVTLVVTLKDASGAMLHVSKSRKILQQQETITFETGFKLPEDTTGHYIEVFAWDNTTDLHPITNVTKFE